LLKVLKAQQQKEVEMTSDEWAKALTESMPSELPDLIPRTRGPAGLLIRSLVFTEDRRNKVEFTAAERRAMGTRKKPWEQTIKAKWKALAVVWNKKGVRVSLKFPNPKGTFRTYKVIFQLID